MPKAKQKLICDLGDHADGLFSQEGYLTYCNKIHVWCTLTESTYEPRSDCLSRQSHFGKNEREVLVNWLIII